MIDIECFMSPMFYSIAIFTSSLWYITNKDVGDFIDRLPHSSNYNDVTKFDRFEE